MEVFEQAVQEVAESGELSFPTRRKLWLALGLWEEHEEDSPCPLTQPLQKRAQLALACAKKVGKVWAAYDPEDKSPQALVKQANACLSGKLPANQLAQLWHKSDYINELEGERYSFAPLAAIAAERAAAVVLYDEFLLAPDYADASDTDLDAYDWDAAWCASLAWAHQDEDASPGEQKVAELKFWAWYLEQTARLLGMEDWKFPKKAVRDFKNRQELARPVPEEVTMESFIAFLDCGLYQCHNTVSRGGINQFAEKLPTYDIHTLCPDREAVCPRCRTISTQLKFFYGVNILDADLPGTGISIRLLHTLPLYQCPNCPDNSFTPRTARVNTKAALKRYLAGPGRLQAFQEELERRAANVLDIGGGYLSLNGATEHHHDIRIPDGIQGLRWLDPEAKQVPLDMGRLGRTSYLTGMTEERLEIDLNRFGPHVYFSGLPLEEFQGAYPSQTETLEDGSIRLTMDRHWVRCWLDGTGKLERVVVQSCFHLEVDMKYPVTLTRFLMEECHLSQAQAEEEIALFCEKGHPCRKLRPLSGLTRAEALELCSKLRSRGIKCRIMPVPVGEKGDTELR